MTEKQSIENNHEYYSISYQNKPLLHGASGDVWELSVEEAIQRRDELNRVIQWCSETTQIE